MIDGLLIMPAENGGWVVTAGHAAEYRGHIAPVIAAVSNDADLLAFVSSWLGGRADAARAKTKTPADEGGGSAG